MSNDVSHDEQAEFSAVMVSLVQRHDGAIRVGVQLGRDQWSFSPDYARKIAGALVACADLLSDPVALSQAPWVDPDAPKEALDRAAERFRHQRRT